MPRHYHSPAARCPYYRGEDSARGVLILCAGIAAASTLRLNLAGER